MTKRFENKVALITGGNGGIGLGMAQALLQSGASVAIWGSNPDKTDKAVAGLSAHGKVRGYVCDVGDEAMVDDVFARTVADMGSINACFANAGVSSRPTPIAQMSAEEFRRVQRVNVDGVFHTFRAAARPECSGHCQSPMPRPPPRCLQFF